MAMNIEPDARKRQILIWYVLAAMFGVLLFQQFWSSYSQVETIPYSQFETLLDQNKVAEVTVAADSIQGTLKEPLPDGKREFYAVRVDPQIFDKLAAHQVVVNGTATSGIVATILSWVIPVVIFYVIWCFCSGACRKARLWRADDRGQVARQGLRGSRYQGDIQGHRRR